MRWRGKLPFGLRSAPKILLSYCHTVKLSYCHTVLLSNRLTILLSYCFTVILSYRLIVILSHCHAVTLSYCHIVCHTAEVNHFTHIRQRFILAHNGWVDYIIT